MSQSPRNRIRETGLQAAADGFRVMAADFTNTSTTRSWPWDSRPTPCQLPSGPQLPGTHSHRNWGGRRDRAGPSVAMQEGCQSETRDWPRPSAPPTPGLPGFLPISRPPQSTPAPSTCALVRALVHLEESPWGHGHSTFEKRLHRIQTSHCRNIKSSEGRVLESLSLNSCLRGDPSDPHTVTSPFPLSMAGTGKV